MWYLLGYAVTWVVLLYLISKHGDFGSDGIDMLFIATLATVLSLFWLPIVVILFGYVIVRLIKWEP